MEMARGKGAGKSRNRILTTSKERKFYRDVILYTLRCRDLTEVPIRRYRDTLDCHDQPDCRNDKVEPDSAVQEIGKGTADREYAPVEQGDG